MKKNKIAISFDKDDKISIKLKNRLNNILSKHFDIIYFEDDLKSAEILSINLSCTIVFVLVNSKKDMPYIEHAELAFIHKIPLCIIINTGIEYDQYFKDKNFKRIFFDFSNMGSFDMSILINNGIIKKEALI